MLHYSRNSVVTTNVMHKILPNNHKIDVMKNNKFGWEAKAHI